MRQSQNNNNIELTSGQVRQMTIETLIRHFNLTIDGYKFNAEDIWNVTVSAAAQGQDTLCEVLSMVKPPIALP